MSTGRLPQAGSLLTIGERLFRALYVHPADGGMVTLRGWYCDPLIAPDAPVRIVEETITVPLTAVGSEQPGWGSWT